MSHHRFTTPKVVYLGQAYRGQDDRDTQSEIPAPRANERSATERLVARPAETTARVTAR